MADDLPSRRVVLCSEEAGDGRYTETIEIEVRELPDWERKGVSKRFDPGALAASISHASLLEKRGGSSSRLSPVNSIELRAIGVACIELAAEMERIEKARG